MNPILAVMRMHLRDKFSWFILPWIILGSSFIINLLLGLSMGEDSGIHSGGLASIFIYMFVIGIMIVPETFAFALGISVRRKDFFMGTSLLVVVTSAYIAIVLILLGYLEKLTGSWGSNLHFFQLPYLSDGGFLITLWIFFVIMGFNLFTGLFLSSFHKRFGKTGSLVVFLGIPILGSVLAILFSYYGWWGEIWDWIFGYSAVVYASWMGLVALISGVLSYAMLRKSTV
jgi:hypothetical protein